jgi:hypothetical protein
LPIITVEQTDSTYNNPHINPNADSFSKFISYSDHTYIPESMKRKNITQKDCILGISRSNRRQSLAESNRGDNDLMMNIVSIPTYINAFKLKYMEHEKEVAYNMKLLHSFSFRTSCVNIKYRKNIKNVKYVCVNEIIPGYGNVLVTKTLLSIVIIFEAQT